MKSKMTITAILIACALGVARDTYVIPVKDETGIYQNKIRQIAERPTFTVKASDKLLVVQEEPQFYFVKTADGRTGWLEKRFSTRAINGTRFSFDPTDIVSSNDLMQPTIIFGTDSSDWHITLTRSFKDEIRVNEDREFFERLAGKY